jgi:hypothetical protein
MRPCPTILAIGLARVYGRRSSLLENVIMTGIIETLVLNFVPV